MRAVSCYFCLSAIAVFLIAWDQAGPSVDENLDKIDSQNFIDGITHPVMGSAAGVEMFALKTPEVQYLIKHSKEAIPKILQRLTRPHGIHNNSAPLVYFIIIQETKDPRALLVLADYLDALPAREEKQATWETQPFLYAVNAAYALLGLPNRYAPFAARHQIATLLRQEFNRRFKQIY